MLYAERVTSAQRVAELAGAKPLAEAWAAVISGDKRAAQAARRRARQRSARAGYLFAEAKISARNEKFAEAAAIMLKAPTRPGLAGRSRRLVDRAPGAVARAGRPGDMKTAYRIAAAHAAESPANAVDAEFHAGWYALRGLDDPQAAAKHFSRIAEIADGPISLSRAYYWLGRAAEAGGAGRCREATMRRRQRYGTTFYGQLAAARIGRGALTVAYPTPTEADRQNFASREAVEAIRRLEQAGYASQADTLYRDLAERTDQSRRTGAAGGDGRRSAATFPGACRSARSPPARGIDIGALSHPRRRDPRIAPRFPAPGKALAYAIARQESEFNVGAVSGAGARGLLQLLPGTAKEVAKKAGLPYSQARLTTDAGYNATLGAAFLGEQLGRFDGSYVLTFAGYNAGPGRAQEWIKRYGDPRGKDIDAVVDWIERIPFAETRSYVQRVMENYQVYKMRLSGRFDIAADLTRGR